jgi:hypothetical protein
MQPQFSIGIDLGTTNSALAYASLTDPARGVHLLDIPQLTAPATLESRKLLPSFAFVTPEGESKAGTGALPWPSEAGALIGTWARDRAAEAPDRAIASAKSWLCNTRIDRREPILPWGAPDTIAKLSPVEASRRYLTHLAAAWNHAFPDAPIADQQVVITVPASFDAVARELTREAALAAGLPDSLILLEEPQAALYAWLDAQGDAWRKTLHEGDSILVCDVGGGTTDLTLVRVESEQGDLHLRRVLVGNHLLIGGDNMDITLAHHAAGRFAAEKKTQLDAWQSVSLWHACRRAKEILLAQDGPASTPITILGRGTRLIGGSISIDLKRDEILTLLVDGFYPVCDRATHPKKQRTSGFRELGLEFESDPAITHHLAQFLSLPGSESTRPTRILLNGGVFKADAFRNRIMQVLASWFPANAAPTLLDGAMDLDFAVARGAAAYGVTKLGKGIRIRGGTPCAYYVGIETSGPAIPGAPRPVKALCVVPQGMEEGTEADVPGNDIGVVVGEHAHFRFFSSNCRAQDTCGALLAAWGPDELQETTSMETELKASTAAGQVVPVRFHSRITELGVFELWCVQPGTSQKWKLEFNIRETL